LLKSKHDVVDEDEGEKSEESLIDVNSSEDKKVTQLEGKFIYYSN